MTHRALAWFALVSLVGSACSVNRLGEQVSGNGGGSPGSGGTSTTSAVSIGSGGAATTSVTSGGSGPGATVGAGGSGGAVMGWLSDYPFRHKVVVDPGLVTATLDLFPVGLRLPDLANAVSDGNFQVTQADGLTPLPTEFEGYVDKGGGDKAAYLWFRADRLETNGAEFYVYYGPSSHTSLDPKEVWSNGYLTVLHCADDPSNGLRNSKTGVDDVTDNDLESSDLEDRPESFGSVVRFSDEPEHLEIPQSSLTDALSVTLWTRVERIDNVHALLTNVNTNSTTPGFGLVIVSGGSNYLGLAAFPGDAPFPPDLTTAFNEDDYQFVGLAINAANGDYHGIANGNSFNLTNANVSGVNLTGPYRVGADLNGDFELRTGNNVYLDEIRISDVVRSPAWFAATKRNLDDPATFARIEPQETP